MALLESLLTAIVRADGDALVLHVGERPYVVASSGQVELSSRTLTFEAMSGMLGQLLSPEARQSLVEFGAVEHHLPRSTVASDERFTTVAAHGGNDIWIEIRRHRRQASAPAPLPVRAEEAPEATEPVKAAEPVEAPQPLAEAAEVSLVTEVTEEVTEVIEEVAELAPVDQTGPAQEDRPSPEAIQEPRPAQEAEAVAQPVPVSESEEAVGLSAQAEAPLEAPRGPRPAPRRRKTDRPALPPDPEVPPVTMVPVPPSQAQVPRAPSEELHPAVVLPLTRGQIRGEPPLRLSSSHRPAGLDRLLRVAATRGASALYLASGSGPAIRVDGEIKVLDGEAALSASEVESLILDILPDRNREALRSGLGTEWICDVPDVGRVRCMSFRDHRGAGGIFRMIPARAISAEQLGLSREIQQLCAEAEGLVLVTGPRASGKSTLIAAFVDLINRTRSDHVITLESQIKFVHESRTSLVSQREVRGDNEELVSVARAALRENPDVLVIEDLRTPELVSVALDAAESGHLVIASLPAHTTTGAIDRIIDQTAPERRSKIQLALAGALRGIVAQVLVRKTGGGRLAARELLLNTSSVANLIAEGKTSQLPLAFDSGRKHGMVPLNDALVAFVQSGVVDAREAYRQAADQTGFLNQLKREGVDTSFAERLA